ncbi:MAG TPA: pyridoxal-phosphate dependent enzyme [Pseudolabrys sp.]|nr:pyridoxal-phosphate dependent enzyme [Pseudolabrys sp.]
MLVPELPPDRLDEKADLNPFIRYRRLISSYRLCRVLGLADEGWSEIVSRLGDRLLAVDGRNFRITPQSRQPVLADAIPTKPRIWVKDETGNVAGSHKGRHLMGVMLYLRVLETTGHAAAQMLRKRRLAIASCGNAALAAAVIARAADWPLDAFIPKEANARVVKRLQELGTTINICERRPDDRGDPCMRSFREAVRNGSIPFSVQGPENGLAVEGGRTLAFEMAEMFGGEETPETVYVQVGGGALASAIAQGFRLAKQIGLLSKIPKLMLVQTAGCAPLARAWSLLSDATLEDAVMHRSHFMRPWDETPSSAATGILDDETYDWWEALKGVRDTGGSVLVVEEATIVRAYELARLHTTIRASVTATAGLAGTISAGIAGETAAVIFSGSDQYGT